MLLELGEGRAGDAEAMRRLYEIGRDHLHGLAARPGRTGASADFHAGIPLRRRGRRQGRIID
jgi:hypothetical protein